ncbi:MAG: transporter substrate-binding domain-containing protein [Eubacteriales bacterium]|nr:transporter substrate-binding domain-containing protein [Eubacteriales bacterium]
MKKTMKLFSAALCFVLCLAMFAGCAKTPAAEPTAAPTAAPTKAADATTAPAQGTSKLDAIKAAGKIVWGTNAEFVPFEMKDGSGTVIGVDADIAAAIAKKLGVELVVEDILFDSLPAALASGQIDFIAAGYTNNEERAQKMDFTDSYYKAKQVVVYKEGATAPAAEDELKGKKIGVQTGTTGDFMASDIENADVQRYDNMTLAVQDLANGTLDYVIGDSLTISMITKKVSGVAIAEAIVYDDEFYAIAVDKGETALLEAINEALKELIDTGAIDASVNKFSS